MIVPRSHALNHHDSTIQLVPTILVALCDPAKNDVLTSNQAVRRQIVLLKHRLDWLGLDLQLLPLGGDEFHVLSISKRDWIIRILTP